MKFCTKNNLWLYLIGIVALVALALVIYALARPTTTTYIQEFNVALSDIVIPANNSTTVSRYQEIPLYSTITQPPGYAPVQSVLANYDIIAVTPEGYAEMQVIGSVVYTNGDTLQIQGVVVRDFITTEDGVIVSNRLISTKIAVIGGSGQFAGAYGSWTSSQAHDFITHIRTEFRVPN